MLYSRPVQMSREGLRRTSLLQFIIVVGFGVGGGYRQAAARR
jgi:hypothetical protein